MTEEQYTMWGYWSEDFTKEADWEQFEKDTMTLNYYQQEATQFVLTTDNGTRLMEHVLGLCGESGEIAEKIKKVLRDGEDLDIEDLSKELGDVLFYVATLADLLDVDLGDIGHKNIQKLKDRRARDVLKGSGDNR